MSELHCVRRGHGYLLDLDGTLVDTHASNLAAYEQAIHEVLPSAIFDSDALLRLIRAGESCAHFIPAVLPDVTDEDLRAIAAHKATCYRDHLSLSRLNIDLVACVRGWRRDGGIIVLVTTAKRVNAMHVIEHHHIVDLFDHMVFGDGIRNPKPAPDIYERALMEASLEASDAEAFEDSKVGMAAARAAGLSVTRVVFEAPLPAHLAHDS